MGWIIREEKLQLILLKKRNPGARDLNAAEQEQINSLLNQAREKSALEVEIGCGNGHFLVEYTKQKPDIFFTGIEIKKSRCLKIIKKIEQQLIDNVCVIDGNAEDVLYNLPAACVDKYHIYFPDPWPKKKHKKRRFLRMPNLEVLCQSLKSGGWIFFASDIFDYYLQAKVLFALHPALELLTVPPPPEIFQSIFAHRFSELEKSIHFVAAVKK